MALLTGAHTFSYYLILTLNFHFSKIIVTVNFKTLCILITIPLFFYCNQNIAQDKQHNNISKTNLTTNYLALGDSYTIGESVPLKLTYPFQLAENLRLDSFSIEAPTIVAKTGWRTDDLIDAIETAELLESYDLVSLLIGVNNQYQGKSIEQYEREFLILLETAIQLAGGISKNVFVLSIPDYGFHPFGKTDQEKISYELIQYNIINKRIALELNVSWFNITDISEKGLLEPNLVAKDGLQPSEEQYQLWVKSIHQEIKKKIN